MPVNPSTLAYAALKLRARAMLVLGLGRRAEGVFDTLLESWPEDAYALASRSHLRAQDGRLELALADAERLVAGHPDRSAADWFNLGFLRDAAGELATAETAFRRALALDPKLDRAWYGLGLTLIRLRRLDEAVAA